MEFYFSVYVGIRILGLLGQQEGGSGCHQRYENTNNQWFQ